LTGRAFHPRRQPVFDRANNVSTPSPVSPRPGNTDAPADAARRILQVFAYLRIEAIDLVPDFENALPASGSMPS